jgi:hypothetical protein
MELQALPEIKPSVLQNLRKNWWLYLLYPVIIFMTNTVNSWTDERKERPCNDRLIIATQKLDSAESSNSKILLMLLEKKK